MQSILQLLAPLTRGLSSPERSEVEHEQEDLVSMLHRLKGVAETVATQASSPQVRVERREMEALMFQT